MVTQVHHWNDYVGQNKMKERLRVHIDAAFADKRPLDHVLLTGPPGAGKTTLANLIAEELTDPIEAYVMPMTRKSLLRAIRTFNGGVLFLDEIHALAKRDQELLLTLLTPGDSHVMDEKGRRFDIGWITVIAATTERDKIIRPLDDRFPIRPDFEPYTLEEMGQIVTGMADRLGLVFDVELAQNLGSASAGIPRNAYSLVTAYRDLSTTSDHYVTSVDVLSLLGLDGDGCGPNHRAYLQILADAGGQAGQKTIETLLRLPTPVLWEIERLLLQLGLVELQPAGRELTPKGWAKVKDQPERGQYERRV